jgi:imidazole glycerol phosphate synthase glutamine amidotransferase subunit
MQLLCAESDESPGAIGLGIIEQRVQRFCSDVQVPQLGWNTVEPHGDDCPFEAGDAYFANSFRLVNPPAEWGYAVTDYGGPFTSSIWRGRVLACQFHPELSGDWGQSVLKNWIANA